MTNIIYPIIKNKYSGCVYYRSSWIVSIRTKLHRYYKAGFQSKEEAFNHLKDKNIEFKLPIKNIIHDRGDYYEVELSQDKRMKFDKDDLNLVQSVPIHSAKSGKTYYARMINKNNSVIMLHNMIMNHEPTIDSTIDHINRDGLDNRKLNLRVASRNEQMTNRSIPKNNTSGIKGVRKEVNGWRCKWNDVIEKSKFFSVIKYGDESKQMAIDYRNEMIANLTHYN